MTAFDLLAALPVVATPIALAAAGELLAERAGVINVALEGTMLAACYAAFAVALATGSPWLALAAAVATGAAFGGALALLAVALKVDAIVAATALNLLAAGATGALFAAGAGGPGAGPAASAIVDPLPRWLLPIAALVLLLAIGAFLRRTRPGLAWIACGENAAAAAAVGIAVGRIRAIALVACGALCGLAGAELLLVESRTFVEGMTAGRGFVALAVVICGRWSVSGVALSAAAFGGAVALQFQAQARGSALPYPLFLMLPYVATLALLALLGRGRRGPAEVSS